MPEDDVLTRLAEIWAAVLLTEVGPETDFFEEGGQSVAALQMITRVEEEYGLELSIRDIFESPTLGEFTEAVRARAGR